MEEQPFKPPFLAEPLIQSEVAVLIIPQDGGADRSQVTADLVHTAGAQFQFQPGEFPRTKTTICGTSLSGRPPDLKLRFNGSGHRFRPARTDCEVLLLDARHGARPPDGFPAGENRRKKRRRFLAFGDQDDPGGVLIQAVYQQRPRGVFGGKDSVQGGPYPFPALHRKTGGLIQNDTPIIFKKYGNILQYNFPNIPISILA